MNIVPYFKQQKNTTCSLAVLRMVLAFHGIQIEEKQLVQQVEKDYGKKFKNIWNPTIAKLALQYGIKTTLISDWPLLKPRNLKTAIKQYTENPSEFNYREYENENDTDHLPEPLPLAYTEFFQAIKLGLDTKHTQITEQLLKKQLSQYLLLISIKLQKVYPNKKGYHSILLYQYKDKNVFYHDPSYGQSLQISIKKLLEATTDVGAAILFA